MRRDLSGCGVFDLAVFAMGDSKYSKFNWVGLQLARRLEQLGGSLAFPVVLCDERHQLGYDFAADAGINLLKTFLEERKVAEWRIRNHWFALFKLSNHNRNTVI